MQRDFPISAIYHETPLEPLGVLALPGVSTGKLTVNGATTTRPLTLKMDPRATSTALGLRQQFTLATTVANMMNRTFAKIERRRAAGAAAQAGIAETLNIDLITAYDASRAPTARGRWTRGERSERCSRVCGS